MTPLTGLRPDMTPSIKPLPAGPGVPSLMNAVLQTPRWAATVMATRRKSWRI